MAEAWGPQPSPKVPVCADCDDGENGKGQSFLAALHGDRFLLLVQVSLE